MRLSKHIGKTLKENPKEARSTAHKLMLRAGLVRQVSPGVYAYMPFLLRVLNKIALIIREGMRALGYEELLLPVLQPRDLWIESGGWGSYAEIDGHLFSFKDRKGSIVCLGPSYQEIIASIVGKEVTSYKQLPQRVYQIQTGFRDENRPRFGLIQTKEFMIHNAYNFDVDEGSSEDSYQAVRKAYENIFRHVGLAYRCVEDDPGRNGGKQRERFMAAIDSGEETIVFCDACGYAALQDWGESRLKDYPQDSGLKPMETVCAPGLIGVKPLADHLGIPVWKTTKTLIFEADDRVVAVMVRGDCDVNETKVSDYLHCSELKLATPEVVKEVTGAEVGYAGPVGLPREVEVIADYYTRGRVNFECGANQTDHHNINVNFERDFPAPNFGDFKLAKQGDLCPRCDKGSLRMNRSIEVGYVAKLGTRITERFNCSFPDKNGDDCPLLMGSHGIGISRVAAVIVELSHDEKGIVWPTHIAPFQVHLIALNLEREEVRKEAEKLYRKLSGDNIEVLFDDRDLRAGEKFGDADLLGMPVRLTISYRTLKERKIELKFRNERESMLVEYDQALAKIKDYYD